MKKKKECDNICLIEIFNSINYTKEGVCMAFNNGKITKRKVYSDFLSMQEGIVKTKDSVICKIGKINKKNYITIKAHIDQLIEDGKIIEVDGILENNAKTVTGTLVAKPGNGFAFVKIDGKNDVYVNERGGAQNGDTVKVAITEAFGRQEGIITEIVERANKILYGDVVRDPDGSIMFKPNDRNFDEEVIIIDQGASEFVGKKAKVEVVYANIITRNKKNAVIGSVKEVYGLSNDPIADLASIAAKYGFEKDFPPEIEAEMEEIPNEVTEEDRLECVNLTHLPFCTIDPETCQDMDDAIYTGRDNKGNIIPYVAIADVTHYVKKDSELDKEALVRALTCYLAGMAFAMLPYKLTLDICSIKPGEDRRVICMKAKVNEDGEVAESQLMQAIVRSRHKLSYEVAEKIFNGEESDPKYDDIRESIKNSYEVSDRLWKDREARGALRIENPEPKYSFNDDRSKVTEVKDTEHLKSMKVIESLMILNNVEVAKFLEERGIPTLYRVHAKPKKEKVARFSSICDSLGVDFDGELTCEGLNKLFKKIEGTDLEDFIFMLALRQLEKAKYQPNNIGHDALKLDSYLHFTAGIRRYSDFIPQRQVKAVLNGEENPYTLEELENIGKYLTSREIAADKASEEVQQLLNTMWAGENINKTFQGHVSGIRNDGLFVKIEHSRVEVFVPYKDILKSNPKNYKTNSQRTSIESKNGAERYEIGNKVAIVITEVDRNTRSIFGESLIKNKIKAMNNALNSIKENKEEASMFGQEDSFDETGTYDERIK